ncbi:hypothetical protein MKW98_017082 [Papaver atlanticum]|uniref:TF-B3 domain-containing protein n=1 Tax=Papaver atlanticum TaxID=357466 RepID=A0AAD4THB0_9MAGN|nr:hypothetical protein MKW98_017082 [Papaver atlanticum]
MAKGPSNNPYEEARKQRLEENMRRFQELGVAKFVNSLKEEVIKIKKKSLPKDQVKVKKTTTNTRGPLRRSTRPRAEASYVEEFVPDSPRRKRLRSSSSTSYIARRIATKMQRSYPLKRAKRFQSRLSSGHPSCVKSLRSSHVSGNFVLKMPQEFCNYHIPKEKLTMVLEDEEGSIYDTRYLGEFAVLSGGWKPFVEDHELDDGDALVLEFIQPRRLKVYIFRVPNGGSEAKVHEIKKARENESVKKVHNFDADEDMADVDYTAQITIPTKRRTRTKL